jgi:hypothetical protein
MDNSKLDPYESREIDTIFGIKYALIDEVENGAGFGFCKTKMVVRSMELKGEVPT